MKKNINKNEKVLWNPLQVREEKNGKILIGDKVYDGDKEILKQIYYLTQSEIEINELIDKYQINSDLIFELIKEKVLFYSVLPIQDIISFYDKLKFDKYPEDTFIDPNLYAKFKEEKLTRSVLEDSERDIQLKAIKYDEKIENRKSYRKFSSEKIISKNELSEIFSVFRQYKDDKTIRYNYATDGGLYPIDLYLYIKDKKVEDVPGGLYVYDPMKNSLKLVSKSCIIPKSVQYSGNVEIFEESYISIFFIFNSYVTMPKYKGNSYLYAAIDCGIMVQLLTDVVGNLDSVGLCSIGDIQFNKIKKFFNLNKYQVLLHSVELGKYDEV